MKHLNALILTKEDVRADIDKYNSKIQLCESKLKELERTNLKWQTRKRHGTRLENEIKNILQMRQYAMDCLTILEKTENGRI